MKKSILLMVTMLASLIVFSQTNTRTSTTGKDSVIILPKAVAREVAKDVIRKDSCQLQLRIVQTNLELSQKNHVYKDSIITNQRAQLELWGQKGKNYETMITLQDTQKKNLEMAIAPLQRDLKKAKRDLVKTKIGGGAVILFLLYIIVR